LISLSKEIKEIRIEVDAQTTQLEEFYKRQHNFWVLPKEQEQLNLVKKRIFDCEWQLSESDSSIKYKLSEIVEMLVLRDIINERKAEQLLKTSIDKVPQALEIINDINLSDSLDIEIDEMSVP